MRIAYKKGEGQNAQRQHQLKVATSPEPRTKDPLVLVRL